MSAKKQAGPSDLTSFLGTHLLRVLPPPNSITGLMTDKAWSVQAEGSALLPATVMVQNPMAVSCVQPAPAAVSTTEGEGQIGGVGCVVSYLP